jgi:hypothetical protein
MTESSECKEIERSIRHGQGMFKVYRSLEDIGNLNFDTRDTSQLNVLNFEFMSYREELGFSKVPRKLKLDSLLKKCKAKFFKVVHESVNTLLKIQIEQFRLPQDFITNVNIETNKKWLNMSIREIYLENGLNITETEVRNKYGVKDEKMILFNELVNLTYADAFRFYIQSHRYMKDFEFIQRREGRKFAQIFDYVAKFYVTYYSTGRGNIMKKIRKNKKIQNSESKKTNDIQMSEDTISI